VVGFDIAEFIDECRRCLGEPSPQLAVKDVVARTVARPADLEIAFGPSTGWRIDKLHNDAELTVLHFVWPPGVDLFPHEHKMWSTVGIYGGVEDNTMYRRVGDRVEVSGHRRGEAGDALMLGIDGIHSVQNPTRQWTAAVHVYGGDFFDHPRLQWDKQTGAPAPFDLSNAKRELADTEARGRRDGVIL
jgi:predicted metal-dependent enzyme (double-stranded beta helix superfamily)